MRGEDGRLRGFFNVCRHHAAAVMTEEQGKVPILRCPYHGWTYSLAGELKGTPDFAGVCDFDKSKTGLVPVEVAAWETFVFVRLQPGGISLEDYLGDLVPQFQPLGLDRFHFVERRRYPFDCNWKVFVDNYLDGGYHVPHLHKRLSSVLDYSQYMIETGENWCLQWSPIDHSNAEGDVAAVRAGRQGALLLALSELHDQLVRGRHGHQPRAPARRPARREVIFDFYFTDVSSPEAIARNKASINVGQRIQDEDTAICRSVQAGLTSRAYGAGRLSVRREGGEHLFHRLLAADLKNGL